jgi:hypothetical protein
MNCSLDDEPESSGDPGCGTNLCLTLYTSLKHRRGSIVVMFAILLQGIT